MERKVFKFFQQINAEKGEPLTEVSARLLLLGELLDIDVQLEKEGLSEEVEIRVDRRIMVATGLSENELDQLSVPDFTELAIYVDQQVSQTASEFIGAKMNVDKPDLIQPIETETGETVDSVEITVPTVKMIRLRNKQKTEIDRALWLTSACTGLDAVDLRKLCVPDWLQLQARLGDFLKKPAAFFQNGTSDT